MSVAVVIPVWALLAGLCAVALVAWVTAWVNAWVAARFVQRGGRVFPSAVERLEELRAERVLVRERRAGVDDDEALGEADEGRVVP